MSRFTLTAVVLLVILFSCATVVGQEPATEPDEPEGKSFKLLRDDETADDSLAFAEEEAEAWDPMLKLGAWQVSLGIGFMNINTTLLSHEQIIYKYNTEATYWGDIEIKGESAFAPTLRLGYSLAEWLSLEGWGGVSISEYGTTIANARFRSNEQGAPVQDDPPIGEFDAERRSLITLQAGVNALWYPLAMGDASGRWHPYVTGGAGNMWYNMNSNYTNETASAIDLNFGGGIRLLADRNVSVRAELIMHRNTLEWTPAENFTELNEGTTLVPLTEYPVLPDGTIEERQVTSFEPNDMWLLHWTLSIHGSF